MDRSKSFKLLGYDLAEVHGPYFIRPLQVLCDGLQGMLTPRWHLIPLLDFRDPCCPMLTEFVYVFWKFLTILTLVSLILVF